MPAYETLKKESAISHGPNIFKQPQREKALVSSPLGPCKSLKKAYTSEIL